LDRSVRRVDRGKVIIGGSPLRLFRVTDAGAALIERVAAGHDVRPSALIDRLVDAGALHPSPARHAAPFAANDVTVVIPVRDHEIDAVMTGLAGVARVIVVDDGSQPPLSTPPKATAPTEVLRLANGGPAAARNAGLAMVGTPLVAFVDADVTTVVGWLDRLLDHFVDADVALVAPRVRSAAVPDRGAAAPPGAPRPSTTRRAPSRLGGRLAGSEVSRSPLDLGAQPAGVRAGTRVSYVPGAAVVARVDALRSVGGFEPTLRTGEDVDLVWRLVEAGRRVRYEPAVSVVHAPRASFRAFLAQRVGYGRSAGRLARRHPGALAPVRVSAWSAGVWAMVATGHPLAALGLGAGTTGALVRKLRPLPQAGVEAIRLAGLGHLHAGRQVASAVTRAWWPPAVVAAVVSRRARRALLGAAVVPAVWDWVRDVRGPRDRKGARSRADIGLASYVALRVADDTAYGAGLWLGAWEARTTEPLRPDLTSWPRPSRYERERRGGVSAPLAPDEW
jgi:mycofactocin glycosyltransferase